MAKDKLTDYDSTASGNLDVGGISVAEGMLPSGVNNAIRELMSHQADAFGAGTPLYVDQTNNRVGIGNAAPTTALDVTGDITLSGGVYLGGTGSANYLDDYEEGTWTPTVSGRTFASSKGHYTKVGNLVFIHFECETISSAISDPLIGGLPFTASPPTGSPADYSSYISCDEVSSWTLSSGYTNIYFRAGAGVTTLQALQSTGETHSSGTSWGTNGNVRASGFYYTNS